MKGKRQHVEARVSTRKVRAKAQRAYIRAHSPRVEPDQYHYFELNAAERVAFSGCVHRPSFIGDAASVVDAFGTLRDCKRPDPSLEGSFEAVCFHFRASGYWIAKSFGRLIDAEERSAPSITTAAETTIAISGPLPPSREFRGYEEAVPGTGKEIIAMARANQ